jgi:hypothetical protein
MSEYEIVEAMIRYGGSFVKSLGQLIRQADSDNKRKIVAAFPEYIDTFRLNDGNVKVRTLDRLDSFVVATAGKRITYKELTH